MWSDNDIDNAFRRLDPAEPEPMPFPLDAWLKLEAGLDQAVIDRAVRRRLWQFFAAEVAVVALVGLGWSLWPAGDSASVASRAQTAAPSTTLSMHKTAEAKRLPGSGASATSKAEASDARPAVGSMASIMPRSAKKSAPAALTEAPVTANAAVAPALPTPGVAGRAQTLPLTVALVPSYYTRFHSAENRLAAPGNSATASVGPTATHPKSASAALVAKPQAEANSRAVAASAGEASSAQPLADPENGHSRAIADQLAGSQMAVLSQATASEVAAAASHGGGAPGAMPAARRLAATSASAGAAKPPHLNSATAASAPAAMDDLSPVVASIAESAQPTAEPLPTLLPPVEPTSYPLPAVVRQPRLYVGLVAAPDVSTVKFAAVKGAHLNLGLTLEYRLGQRWRVTTGLQRSTKDYSARREDYDWTNYPRAQTRDFSWVEGKCTVLDIPLNLRYDALVQGHARWFGAAGLSSFFMHRENYSYDYLENGTYKPWEIPGLVNANRNLFSILNLSAGYEYGLGTHWHLQGEPYVKVPLAGVGAGKVKLLSAGIYLGVKYGF